MLEENNQVEQYIAPDRKIFLEKQETALDLTFVKAKNVVDYSWHNVTLTSKGKTRVASVSGSVRAGEVCAVLGSKTSQKAPLIRILAGRLALGKKDELEGEFKLQGAVVDPTQCRDKIALIKADDHIYGSSTVREALMFSASLRLPGNSPLETSELVDQFITGFKLTEIKDTKVGYFNKSKISASQRKRVSIALEMLTGPHVLVLDDPLKHCNHFQAWTEARFLHSLAESTGCSVICSIEKPRSEVFNQFDNIMVMSKGSMVFNGKVSDMPQIMAKLGKPIPFLSNPADFLMFVADNLPPGTLEYNIETGKTLPATELDVPKVSISPVDNELKKSMLKVIENDVKAQEAPILKQFRLMFVRELKNFFRAQLRPVIISRGLFFLALGGIMNGAGDRDNNEFSVTVLYSGVQYHAFVTFLMNLVPGMIFFGPIKKNFIREMQLGTYKPIALFSIRLFFDLLTSLIGAFITVLMMYLIIEVEGDFMTFVGCILAIAFTGQALGQIVSSAFVRVPVFMPRAVIILNVILSGSFLPITRLDPMNWVQYTSVLKYAIAIMQLTEFEDCGSRRDFVDLLDDAQSCNSSCIELQEEVDYKQQCLNSLNNRDIFREEFSTYLLMLIILGIVFKLGSYLVIVVRSRKFKE